MMSGTLDSGAVGGSADAGGVTPRPSASVMILRDGRDGIEVFMLKRSPQLDFSPNYLVFPGGGVDPADESPALLDDYDRSELLVYQLTAIREAFEESGFLFAEGDIEPLLRQRVLAAVRRQLLAGEGLFYEEIARKGLQLTPAQLHPVSHWITPVPAPRRFSTYFFLARQPSGQEGSHDGMEAVDALWMSAAQVLALCDREPSPIMFPTEMNCRWLARFDSVTEALTAAQSGCELASVTPRIELRDGARWLTLPADAGYGEVARKL
ncbi:NUDIX hydrolase [Exilibacterium tricleocarpae]|nr:NUDIX domain-containing protein [Exilibacterium tricleocarpae]